MKRAFTVILRLLIAAAAMALVVRMVRPDPRLTVTVLDVGQGDAILVQCGNQQLLVDGGPDDVVLSQLGATMPFFDRTIEAVVLTHPHRDHYFGLIGVMGRYRVGRLVVSDDGAAHDDDDDVAADERALQDAALLAGVPASAAHPGERIPVGDCGHAEVLWPVRSADGIPWSDPNTSSVVLRVTRNDAVSPRAAVLLTGDATDHVEHALLRAGVPVAADVLKAGHHGSRTSSSPEFLDAVRPAYAVISNAAKNKYGHPAPITLLRFKNAGAKVFRTDQHGNVRIVVLPERAYVER